MYEPGDRRPALLTMPEKLPPGWIETTLGEVCAINPPTRFDHLVSEDSEVSFVPMAAVEAETGRLDASQTRILASVRTKYRAFQENDVIFAKITPCMENGKIALATGLKNGLAYGSTEFLVFRPRQGLLPRFVLYYLLQPELRKEAELQMTGVVGQKRVPAHYLATREFPLPPSAEQARIVQKLDASLLGLQRGQDAVRRAQSRLQRYRSAVLDAAVAGKLTDAWRAARRNNHEFASDTGASLLLRLSASRRARWEESELRRLRSAGKAPRTAKWKQRYTAPRLPIADRLPEQPSNWAWASIDQLAWNAGYGTSVKCSHDARGPAVLRIPNIRNRKIVFKDLKYATDTKKLRPQDFISPGDLLLIRTNGSKELVGRAAIVRTPLETNYGFASYLIRFRLLGESTLWSWVELVWDSHLVRSAIESRAKTTAGQYNVSLSALAGLTLPLPPLHEQAEIIRQVEHRLVAADRLEGRLDEQLARASNTRALLLSHAVKGLVVNQNKDDEPASELLARMAAERVWDESTQRKFKPRDRNQSNRRPSIAMTERPFTSADLRSAFGRIGKKADARRLFAESGCTLDQVTAFYETLRETPEVRAAFEPEATGALQHIPAVAPEEIRTPLASRFRLSELWLEEFKNLRDYTVRFDVSHGLDVVLGWNGTGKSNLFEFLVIVFRDLHDWSVRGRWPTQPVNGYRISYELDNELIRVVWDPHRMKRPSATKATRVTVGLDFGAAEPISRKELPLPRFVFGYYSGPTNRLAEHFLPMKQAHYARLREAEADDEKTLTKLLEQRRFFCAETHHAKYVLLAFSYREDEKISAFLRDRLRIVGFESALFVIRKPRWAKTRSTSKNFWGATGIMRRVMERLRRYAIAPMTLKQIVSDGYRTTAEDHCYFLLPDLQSLHAFAGEYPDARTFFLALESTDFSELIYDVKIQVRVRATEKDDARITFHQMSEGEQQLLMVLGLMRFTKSHQSLVLLDEPDTHLNPHWSIDYLKDLTRVMGERGTQAPEQQSSQLLMATHDPLVIASLVKEQIHLLTRDSESGACKWVPAAASPRGLGFAGILTSEMFGFRSDLDEETLKDLDSRVRLVGKEGSLTAEERGTLEEIDGRLVAAGFGNASSDPYYAAFVRAWGRRHAELMAGRRSLSPEEREEVDRVAGEVLREATAEVDGDVQG